MSDALPTEAPVAGELVSLHSLNRQELNGQRAIVTGQLGGNMRLPVQLIGTGANLSVRLHNVTRTTGESADVPICRICFEPAAPHCPLSQPCSCRGTSAWAHLECLTRWRRSSVNIDAAIECGQCKQRYRDRLSIELIAEAARAQRDNFGSISLSNALEMAREFADQGHYAEAEALYRHGLRSLPTAAHGGVDERVTDMACDATNNLAMAMLEGGDLGGALPLLRRTLEVSRGSLGDRHPSTLTSVNNLGRATPLGKSANIASGSHAPLVLRAGSSSRRVASWRRPSSSTARPSPPAATSSAPRTRTPSTRPSTSRVCSRRGVWPVVDCRHPLSPSVNPLPLLHLRRRATSPEPSRSTARCFRCCGLPSAAGTLTPSTPCKVCSRLARMRSMCGVNVLRQCGLSLRPLHSALPARPRGGGESPLPRGTWHRS